MTFILPVTKRTTSIASRHFLQLLDDSRSVMLFTTVSIRAEPPRFLRMLKFLSYLTKPDHCLVRSLIHNVPRVRIVETYLSLQLRPAS